MPADLQSYSGLYGTVGATTAIAIKDGEIDLPALEGGLIPHRNIFIQAMGNLRAAMAV